MCFIFMSRRQWQPTPALLPGKSHVWRNLVGYSPWGREESVTTERLHFHFHALEKEMATHSSILAWRIPGTEDPGGLPSTGLHRVGHDWSDLAAAAADIRWTDIYIYIYIYVYIYTHTHTYTHTHIPIWIYSIYLFYLSVCMRKNLLQFFFF